MEKAKNLSSNKRYYPTDNQGKPFFDFTFFKETLMNGLPFLNNKMRCTKLMMLSNQNKGKFLRIYYTLLQAHQARCDEVTMT